MSDIESLFHIMPESDKLFYQNVFKKLRELQVNVDESNFEMMDSANTQVMAGQKKSNQKNTKQKRKLCLPRQSNPKVLNHGSKLMCQPRTSSPSSLADQVEKADEVVKFQKPLIKRGNRLITPIETILKGSTVKSNS